MKRLFTLVVLSLVATSLFAATDKTLNEKAFVEWEFKPEVSTYFGYNLDVGGAGLEGKAKLEITSTIFDKADMEFSEDQKPYGYVKIEDLEIKATAKHEGAGSTSEKYKSTENTNTEPLSISWGTISGVIYAGPVYVKLAHDGHGDQGFIEKGLDDGDLDYSVINYSIISASDTAQYVGARKIDSDKLPVVPQLFQYRVKNVDGKIVYNDITDGTNQGSDTLADKLAGSNNAISVGFKQDKLLDIRLGVSSAGSYKTYQKNNPIQLSLFFELLAIENVILKLQTTAIAGVHPSGSTGEDYDDEGKLLSEGNPLTVGLLLGYKMPMGINTLTTSLGFEVSLENEVDKFGAFSLTVPVSGSVVAAQLAGTGDDTVNVTAFEAALGVKYDWKSLGYDADEDDDHIDATGSGKDIKVTDGASLGLLYGSMPNAVFRDFKNNYVGAKISVWDSQDDDKPGLLPLELALVLNYNYVFGGEYEPEGFEGSVTGANTKVTNTKFTLGARQDFGLLLETAMTFGYIKPFLNVAWRMFNITDVTEVEVDYSIDGGTNVQKGELQQLADKSDLRLKLGFDVVNLVKNVTFSAWWESGNVMKSDDIVKATYNATSSFYTTKDTINKVNGAKLGFIAIGAKIEY